MEKKGTKKNLEEKNEQLKQENEELRKQIEILFKQLVEIQEKADNDFQRSPYCKQLLDKIFILENNVKLLEKTIDRKKNKEDYIHKLINANKKIHNERNAGRRPKFSENEVKEILELRKKGSTIKELALQYNCSIGLIHKLISELKA